MEINTKRLGRMEVPTDAIIQFPQGLIGMESHRRFVLLQHDQSTPYFWLQSADDPAVAMVLANPFHFFPDYVAEVPDSAADLIEAESATDVVIYTTVSVANNPHQTFTNLLGPLVINHSNRTGVQIILDERLYSTRHALTEPRAAEAVAA